MTATLTRGELVQWLDRKPLSGRRWESWFDARSLMSAFPAYLGERSARTGPDAVKADRRCECEQCATVRG